MERLHRPPNCETPVVPDKVCPDKFIVNSCPSIRRSRRGRMRGVLRATVERYNLKGAGTAEWKGDSKAGPAR